MALAFPGLHLPDDLLDASALCSVVVKCWPAERVFSRAFLAEPLTESRGVSRQARDGMDASCFASDCLLPPTLA